MPNNAPAERGAPVRYHGSLTALHGTYLYDGPCMCDEDDYCACCVEDLPDRHQLAYDEPPGPGGVRRLLQHVHRTSFTPIHRNEES